MLSRFVGGMLAVGLMALGAGMVSGQTYPNKAMRLVTPGIGGSADIVARIVAQGISGPLGQQVIVDNRVGIVAIETVAKAPPDGYTLLLFGNTIWIEPLLQSVPYNPVRDFSPITLATASPNILVVHPAVPAKSVAELIALAKAKPGDLNYASSSTGGSAHLAAELFKAMTGVNIVRINYKGTGPAVNDLIGGQVQMMFANAAGVVPHVKSGRLRALAVTSAEPSALVPGLPTVAISVPGYEATTTYSIFSPAKTPTAIIVRLNQEIVRVLNRADMKEKFFGSGVEAIGSSPEQLAVAMRADMVRLGKVIKDAGIHEE